mgnify:FL=1
MSAYMSPMPPGRIVSGIDPQSTVPLSPAKLAAAMTAKSGVAASARPPATLSGHDGDAADDAFQALLAICCHPSHAAIAARLDRDAILAAGRAGAGVTILARSRWTR